MTALDNMIERQQGAVAEVERRLAERGVSANSTRSLVDGARTAVNGAQQYLDELLARKSARDAAIVDHQAAEVEHADDLVQLGQELEAARRQLGDRVSAAIAALEDAWRTAEAFDALLASKAAWLRSIGMPAVYQPNGDDEARFDTGGHESTALGRPWLLLAGQRWHALGTAPVLHYIRQAVVAGHEYFDDPRTSTTHQLLDPVTARPAPMPFLPAPAGPRPARYDVNQRPA